MGVGEVGNQLAGVVEVQRRGNVVAALVPVVGQMEQGQMADRHRREEQQKKERPGQSRESGAGLAKSIGGRFHGS